MSDSDFVLLVGPMSDVEHRGAPDFYTAERELIEAGYAALNPARTDAEMGRSTMGDAGVELPQGFDRPSAILAAMESIHSPACVGVCMVGDWQSSSGAYAEVYFAMAIDKPVGTVAEWADGSVFDVAPEAEVGE